VFVNNGSWFLSRLQPTKALATKIRRQNIHIFYQDNFQRCPYILWWWL